MFRGGSRVSGWAICATAERRTHADGVVGMAGRGSALQVLAVVPENDPMILLRDCVDCGRRTGRFCDYCFAEDRFPKGDTTGRPWACNQLTPLCSFCDNARDACHFCLGIYVTRPVEIYRGMSREEVMAGGAGSVGESSGAAPKHEEKVLSYDEVSLVHAGMALRHAQRRLAAEDEEDQTSKMGKTWWGAGPGDGQVIRQRCC